jgi:hypothetical protein
MLHYFGEEMGKPEYAWYTIVIVGLVTTMLLWIYDRIVRPVEKAA